MIKEKEAPKMAQVISIGEYRPQTWAPSSVDRKTYDPYDYSGSKEVFPFYTEEEIMKMIDRFQYKIDIAVGDTAKNVAQRNMMMFVCGINSSLRISDFCKLKWEHVMDENGKLYRKFNVRPTKTRRHRKEGEVYFNPSFKTALVAYLAFYKKTYGKLPERDSYIFFSKKGKTPHLTEISCGRILKQTAEEIGLPQNINSHSMRQTFARHFYLNAEDKGKALTKLQQLLMHSDQRTTCRYIKWTDDEVEEMYATVDLGGNASFYDGVDSENWEGWDS